jgi:hypothetical protein
MEKLQICFGAASIPITVIVSTAYTIARTGVPIFRARQISKTQYELTEIGFK